jgi:hypothetical protein
MSSSWEAVVQLLRNFPIFYATRRSITMSIRVIHWSLTIQLVPLRLISQTTILMLSTHLHLGFLTSLFPSGFPNNNLYVFLFFPIRAIWPTLFILVVLIVLHIRTWRRVQIIKLHVMQFSPLSRHFIPLRSKYPPQHPVLKHPQSMFLS